MAQRAIQLSTTRPGHPVERYAASPHVDEMVRLYESGLALTQACTRTGFARESVRRNCAMERSRMAAHPS
jgi:hypothetical protein